MHLYKRRTDGGINIWWAELGTYKPYRYRTHHGLVAGEKVTSAWTACSAKRGYTPAEQAQREVDAMYRKKRNEGYTDDIAKIDTSKTFFQPMLAHHFKDCEATVRDALRNDGYVFVQPKYDGMRCILDRTGMWSRRGKLIHSAPHISEAVWSQGRAVKYADLQLDGELYTHKFAYDFNRIISLAKKQKPTPEELEESAKHLQYHVYDLPSRGDRNFDDRITALKAIIKDMDDPCIKLAPTKVARSFEEIDAAYAKYREAGYEGAIIRLDRPYQNKRSKFLLKYKEFQDAEFIVKGVHEGTGNRSGMAGFLSFQTKVGKPFTAAIMGSDDFRRTLLRDKRNVVGRNATVQFQNMTPAGVPRFPCVKTIRDYE